MSELQPHAEKLSIARLIAKKTCVRKNFHGEWFTGIVQTVRTCSTGRVLVNVMYIEDNDDEDLDADEFLCLVDVDSWPNLILAVSVLIYHVLICLPKVFERNQALPLQQ